MVPPLVTPITGLNYCFLGRYEPRLPAGCHAGATSTRLAAACLSRDQRPGGARSGVARAAIYGTIVATAVIATTGGGHESAALILEATLATLLVFWLAHVYARLTQPALFMLRSPQAHLVGRQAKPGRAPRSRRPGRAGH
jgi:hypothetical protein